MVKTNSVPGYRINMQVFGTCRANLFMRSFADKILNFHPHVTLCYWY